MTKKQMKEKYTKMMESAQDDRDFYRGAVMDAIEKYCTTQEIAENSIRKLVNITLDRIEALYRENFVSDWTLYQKARREMSIITEILCDLH